MPEPKKQPEIIQQQEQKETIEVSIQAQDLQKNNQEVQHEGQKSIQSGMQTLKKMETINPNHDS